MGPPNNNSVSRNTKQNAPRRAAVAPQDTPSASCFRCPVVRTVAPSTVADALDLEERISTSSSVGGSAATLMPRAGPSLSSSCGCTSDASENSRQRQTLCSFSLSQCFSRGVVDFKNWEVSQCRDDTQKPVRSVRSINFLALLGSFARLNHFGKSPCSVHHCSSQRNRTSEVHPFRSDMKSTFALKPSFSLVLASLVRQISQSDLTCCVPILHKLGFVVHICFGS